MRARNRGQADDERQVVAPNHPIRPQSSHCDQTGRPDLRKGDAAGPNAVRPGDVLTVETEILDLRASRSKPGYGIIRLRNMTTNQHGEVVQTMLASAMVPRRVA